MTLDELQQKLAEAGIPINKWGETKEGTRSMPPTVLKQKELLTKLRDILQVQVDQDKIKLAELHEVANRLKHGGGR